MLGVALIRFRRPGRPGFLRRFAGAQTAVAVPPPFPLSAPENGKSGSSFSKVATSISTCEPE